MNNSHLELEKVRFNLETAKIPWSELQRFFAAGLAIFVHPQLDLIDVAYQFSADNKMLVEHWLKQQQIYPVTDAQAADWYDLKTEVWAVVVKPWVLVQGV